MKRRGRNGRLLLQNQSRFAHGGVRKRMQPRLGLVRADLERTSLTPSLLSVGHYHIRGSRRAVGNESLRLVREPPKGLRLANSRPAAALKRSRHPTHAGALPVRASSSVVLPTVSICRPSRHTPLALLPHLLILFPSPQSSHPCPSRPRPGLSPFGRNMVRVMVAPDWRPPPKARSCDVCRGR